jgi:CheY-like chemotaxis protein
VESTPSIKHWLVSVAAAAGLPGADELDVTSDVETADAWDVVAATTDCSPDELAMSVARHYGLDMAALDSGDANACRLVPESVARRLNVLPLRYSDRLLAVATADPVSMEAERELAEIAGRAIHFEVAPPAPIREAVEAGYAALPSPNVAPTPEPEGKDGRHVLVVDDDADTRLLLRAVLERKEFRVSEAPDGQKALEMVSGPEAFDLVTLDLSMPEMSGIEVLKSIRSRVSTANLPVVVATGSDDPETEMELFNAGADDFIVKPVDPPRFLLRIQAVLRRRGRESTSGFFF